MKFIPRFKAFNHYKCDAMLCSSVCGSAVWRLMNEARDDVREKRENEKKKQFCKCLFIQLPNSLTHDIANLRNSRKRSTLVTNAIEVTTCSISAHKTDRREENSQHFDTAAKKIGMIRQCKARANKLTKKKRTESNQKKTWAHTKKGRSTRSNPMGVLCSLVSMKKRRRNYEFQCTSCTELNANNKNISNIISSKRITNNDWSD